jgi:group I intron endonuclease
MLFGIIYKITNKVNGKCYIGRTTSLKKRFEKHLSGGTPPLRHAVRKFGKENFTIEVLCKIPDKLATLERKYIKDFKSYDRHYGYNRSLDGCSSKGCHWKHSKQALERMSKAQKKRYSETPMLESTRDKLRKNAFKQFEAGMPKETKAKISNTLSGRELTKEHRQRISKALRGRPHKSHFS